MSESKPSWLDRLKGKKTTLPELQKEYANRDPRNPSKVTTGMADLRNFFKSMSDADLREAYEQTRNALSSESHPQSYPAGGGPSNTLHEFALIQHELDSRNIDY